MVILIRKMHDWFNHSSNICQGSDFPNPKWILSKLTPDCYDYSGVFYYWTRKFLQFNHFSSVSTWNLENHPGQSVRSRLVLPIIECSMFRNIKMEHSSFELKPIMRDVSFECLKKTLPIIKFWPPSSKLKPLPWFHGPILAYQWNGNVLDLSVSRLWGMVRHAFYGAKIMDKWCENCGETVFKWWIGTGLELDEFLGFTKPSGCQCAKTKCVVYTSQISLRIIGLTALSKVVGESSQSQFLLCSKLFQS